MDFIKTRGLCPLPIIIILGLGFYDVFAVFKGIVDFVVTTALATFVTLLPILYTVANTIALHYQLIPAPLLWISLGFIIRLNLPCWYRPPDLYRRPFHPAAAPDHAHRRKPSHHRRYPLRLRNSGHYTSRKPSTYGERETHDALSALQTRVLSLQAQVRRLTDRRRFDREGGKEHELPSTQLLKSFGSWHSVRSPRRRPQKYTPVLGSGITRHGSTHGLGNTGWTTRQRQAANKILTQVHMARIEPTNADTPALLRMALQAPLRFRASIAKERSYPVIWDSGASFSVSPNKNDFVGPIKSPSTFTQLQGISKGLRIEGHGHVMWAIHDTAGQLRMIKVPAYYAPRIRVRLLSTTSLLQSYPKETIHVEPHQLTLTGITGDPTRGEVIVRVDPRSNLPTSEAYSYNDPPKATAAL